jgi:epoxyqueuosine reductase QueG
MSLNQVVEDFLLERGALKVGVATVETLAGGPPSADIDYRLKGARSAVSFALPLSRDHIVAFLGKADRVSHESDNIDTNLRLRGLSWELAEMLKQSGHESRGTAANIRYRWEDKNWEINRHPDISHRYMAVRSGVGSFGWSGNVGIVGHGTAILLGTCVTTAELEPTEPIPEEESFCTKCRLCVSACPAEMFEREKEMSVTLGGVTFTHSARVDTTLCVICCGGHTGLHKSKEWSSWSPGRFALAENAEGLIKQYRRTKELLSRRPPIPGGFDGLDPTKRKNYLTCGNCQLICWGDEKETAKNHRMLHKSGCILQRPDGTMEALPPDEAEAEFMKLAPDQRTLYLDIPD